MCRDYNAPVKIYCQQVVAAYVRTEHVPNDPDSVSPVIHAASGEARKTAAERYDTVGRGGS